MSIKQLKNDALRMVKLYRKWNPVPIIDISLKQKKGKTYMCDYSDHIQPQSKDMVGWLFMK